MKNEKKRKAFTSPRRLHDYTVDQICFNYFELLVSVFFAVKYIGGLKKKKQKKTFPFN